MTSWEFDGPEAGVRPVGSGAAGVSLAGLTTEGGHTSTAASAQALQAIATRTAETALAVAAEAAAPAALDDTITVSGRSQMVTRLFGDNPELALTPDAATEDDMRLATGKVGVSLPGKGFLAPAPQHGLDVAGKYGATQTAHPAMQAVVAMQLLGKLGAAQLAGLSPKNLLALLVYQFLTAADRALLSQLYEYAQAKGFNPALVDALAYDLGVFRSASAGASLVRDHVGLFFSADGRAVAFGFGQEDEATAVRILTSAAMRDTVIPHDWLRYQLDPGMAIRAPRTPLAFLEHVVYAFSSSAPGRAGQADPQAVLGARPEQRLAALRAAGVGQLPAAATDAPEGEVTTIVQAQRYQARVEKVLASLPLRAVAAAFAAANEATSPEAGAAVAASLSAGAAAGGMLPAQEQASTRLVAGLLQIFSQHDKQLMAALYAGAEQAAGPASPEINKLDLMVRQMALAAAMGAVPGAEELTRAQKKKRKQREAKKEPRGRDYREFNAWLEEQQEQSGTSGEAEAGTGGSEGGTAEVALASELPTPRAASTARFAEELLEDYIEHRKLYG